MVGSTRQYVTHSSRPEQDVLIVQGSPSSDRSTEGAGVRSASPSVLPPQQTIQVANTKALVTDAEPSPRITHLPIRHIQAIVSTLSGQIGQPSSP
jgi:hypothetical protein